MTALIVNLYGGPGTGKSTTAAGVFCKLKMMDVNAELVTEYAKDKVWEESYKTLDDQIYVFGKQLHRIFRVRDKVEVVVTDSPLLMSLYYGKNNTFISFHDLVRDVYYSMNSLDVFLRRKKPFNPKGRIHTLSESKEIDSYLLDMLEEEHIDFLTYDADEDAPQLIATEVMSRIRG